MTENIDFTALTANPLFYRTYSRYKADGTKESAKEAKDRAINGLKKFKLLTEKEVELITKYFYENKVFVSGRWFWVGGTEWVEKQKNFIGAYNCASVPVTNWDAFRFNFRALLMGCGVGTVVELDKIEQLPEIKYPINLVEVTELGTNWEEGNPENDDSYFTAYKLDKDTLSIVYTVGDSKEGWVDVATNLLEFSSTFITDISKDNRWEISKYKQINLSIDLSYVRPAGIKLKGFGGLSNPDLLEKGLRDIIDILNKAVGRKLNSLEVCKILGIHGVVTVAGSIRRSARINQGTPTDISFAESKDNLWIQDENGKWKIDPERDMLRYANHTLAYHVKPSLEDTIEAVRKQYYSGEGAIQYVPEAVARANADLLDTPEKKLGFINAYVTSIRKGANYLKELCPKMDDKELEHRIRRYGLNPSLRGDAKLLTTEGYKTLEELEGKTFNIINPEGGISESKVWQTGVKETVEISLSTRAKIYCTPDHIFKVGEEGLPAEWLKGKQLTPYLKVPELPPLYRILGFIQGDGVLSKLAVNSVVVFIGKKDGDILDLLDEAEVEYKYRPTHSNVYNLNKYLYSLEFDLNTLITRTLPKTYSSWTKEDKSAFLNGLYSANGTVIKGGRVAFKTVCKELADQLVYTLREDFGISAYITTNKPTSVKFDNGTYLCKMSYDVNIQQYDSRCLFFNNIGFSIKYKTERLANYLLTDAPVVRMVRPAGVAKVYDFTEPLTNWGVVDGFVTHNCGEIIGDSFQCNLSEVHLNVLDPNSIDQQIEAFRAATLSTLPLLSHEFDIEEFKYSREIDPIIGISFTGLFDFFVNKFGADWLKWWKTGRDKDYINADFYLSTERICLERWKNAVRETVEEYCKRHKIKQPSRYTTCQPAGSKSLLTGASPGWHPPKDTRYIRRITFSKDNLVTQACMDYGYKVIPSQSCKDENGNLLDDINDPRVSEILVEIPIEVSWASIADEANFKPKDISAIAQLDFYMQVQRHYVGHNCFSRDTTFLTDLGIKSFQDFEPGDIVKVLNKNGDWVDSTVVRTEDLRTLYEIKLIEGKTTKEKTIIATGCHRFPTRRISGGNSVIKTLTTLDLKSGHRFVTNSSDLPDIDVEGIRHGIVFGDGSKYKNKKGEYVECQVYLVGTKRADLQSFFAAESGRTHEHNEYDQTRIYGLPLHYKDLPNTNCSQSYLAGFVAGLFATDGSIFKSTLSFSTTREDVLGFLNTQLPRLGVRITNNKWYPIKGIFAKDGATCAVCSISKSSFPENLILRSHHLEHFLSTQSQPCQWKVVSVSESPEKQYGWCVMEPETEHFTLSDNILVMNTSGTIELSEHEIEPLGQAIYELIQNDEGYISTALLAKFESLETFPRLPFEPISHEQYLSELEGVKQRQISDDFLALVNKYSIGETSASEQGPSGCDSDKCLLPERK